MKDILNSVSGALMNKKLFDYNYPPEVKKWIKEVSIKIMLRRTLYRLGLVRDML